MPEIVQQRLQEASANGDGYALSAAGRRSISLHVSGTFVATVSFEATIDGRTWVPIAMSPQNGGGVVTSTVIPGIFTVIANVMAVRSPISGYVSGAVLVVGLAQRADGTEGAPGPQGLAGAGSVAVDDASIQNVGTPTAVSLRVKALGIVSAMLAAGTSLTKFVAPTADFDFGNFRLTGLATPTATADAATKGYVDSFPATLMLGRSGVLPTTTPDAADFHLLVPANMTLQKLKAITKTAPTVDTTLQIRRSTDGGATFADLFGTITITAGTRSAQADPSDVDVDEGQVLQFSLTSGGGSGSNLAVMLLGRRR